jgi:hypothetical protein
MQDFSRGTVRANQLTFEYLTATTSTPARWSPTRSRCTRRSAVTQTRS